MGWTVNGVRSTSGFRPAAQSVRGAIFSAPDDETCSRSDLALEKECDHQAVDRDRLDQHHAENEVHEHVARRTRIAGDAGGRVAGGEALTDAAAETGETDGEARAEAGAESITGASGFREGDGRGREEEDRPDESLANDAW